mmetsp:Transcript_22394/g.39450  ORF Transcript_22394/g.39450 Transcript_22394/m.39450 type:complete len:165 (+) Transcript_22394:177-671(+)
MGYKQESHDDEVVSTANDNNNDGNGISDGGTGRRKSAQIELINSNSTSESSNQAMLPENSNDESNKKMKTVGTAVNEKPILDENGSFKSNAEEAEEEEAMELPSGVPLLVSTRMCIWNGAGTGLKGIRLVEERGYEVGEAFGGSGGEVSAGESVGGCVWVLCCS